MDYLRSRIKEKVNFLDCLKSSESSAIFDRQVYNKWLHLHTKGGYLANFRKYMAV